MCYHIRTQIECDIACITNVIITGKPVMGLLKGDTPIYIIIYFAEAFL